MINLVWVARWAGIPIWELAYKPFYWYDAYRTAMEVEQTVQENHKEAARGNQSR